MARLLTDLQRNWGWVLARGVLAVLFGVAAFAFPGPSLLALVLLWGAYALADGIVALIAGFRLRDSGKPLWPFILIGVLGVGAGLVALVRPTLAGTALLAIVAGWAIVAGLFQVVAAFRLRREIRGEWLLALSGALSVAFGVLVVLYPAAGALSILWMIAAFAIAFGVLLIVLAIRLRRLPAGPKSTANTR